MIIRVDIDETICEYAGERKYELASPILENIDKINKLYDEGNIIIYWTARGSSISSLQWSVLTKKQLKQWGCKYHELRLDKPHYDLIIDDKSKRIEEL